MHVPEVECGPLGPGGRGRGPGVVGGGASDIRIGGTALSDRKIVAAGGGGAGGNRFQGCGRGAGGGGEIVFRFLRIA